MTKSVRFLFAVTGGALAYAAVHLNLTVLPGPAIGLGLLVGVVVALVAQGLPGVAASGLAVLLGFIVDSLGADPVRSGWDLLLGAPLAMITTYVASRFLARQGARGRRALAALGLAICLAAMIGSTVVSVSTPMEDGRTTVQMLADIPQPGTYATDEALYLRTSVLMHDGAGYYTAVEDAFAGLDTPVTSPGGAINRRLPTLFWLWGAMPGSSGASLVALALLAGTLATASAWQFARRCAGPAAGVVAAALTAMFYAEIASTTRALHTEPYAAACALAAMALFAAAYDPRTVHRMRWLWAAAAMALLGALFRELQVVVLVGGLAGSIVASRREETRDWMPWAAGLGVFVAAYLAHVLSVGGSVLSDRSFAYWLGIDMEWAGRVLTYGSTVMAGGSWLPAVLAIAALAGVFATRSGSLRIFLLVGVLVPGMAFTLLGPSGWTAPGGAAAISSGGAPAYWGGLIVPPMLVLSALMPLVGQRVAGDRGGKTG